MRSPNVSRRRKGAAAAMVLFALASTLHVLPAGAARERAGLDACDGRGVISAARLPARIPARACDLVGRHVRSGSVRLEVPAPGHGVSAASVGMGFETDLTIVTEPDGDVVIDDGSAEGEAALTAATEPCDTTTGCLAPCDATNFHANVYNARVKQKQPWFLKVSSRPASLTAAQAVSQLKAGTKNVVDTRNDCGLSDVVGPTSPYKGTTSRASGITVVGGLEDCPNSNGKNIVDFGALGQFTLGLACTHYVSFNAGATWSISEADIRFKKSAPWAVNPDAPGCSNQYDLQGVMTHERAHAFGLGHADPVVANTNLTMFPSAVSCTSYARTLGKGDRAGLAFLY